MPGARQEHEKLSPEVQKILAAGDEYVRKIREANDAIPGEEGFRQRYQEWKCWWAVFLTGWSRIRILLTISAS